MLPYLEQPILRLGPLAIHAFGVSVALALWVGVQLAGRRFQQAGLDPLVGHRLAAWMLGGGILGAHLFSVLLYFPDRLRDDPWLILRLWEHISSFGGMLGGVAGALVFFHFRADPRDRLLRWTYLDAVAFVFPTSLAIGRLGCTLAHDHPGTVTTFPLAVSIKSGAALSFIQSVYAEAGRALTVPSRADAAPVGFHDLGWYEFLFLTFVVVPVFQFLSRRDRARGFYLLCFPALYLPVRFGIDFLRVSDLRYVGLTPAQWVAAIVMLTLPFFARRVLRRERDAVAA